MARYIQPILNYKIKKCKLYKIKDARKKKKKKDKRMTKVNGYTSRVPAICCKGNFREFCCLQIHQIVKGLYTFMHQSFETPAPSGSGIAGT